MQDFSGLSMVVRFEVDAYTSSTENIDVLRGPRFSEASVASSPTSPLPLAGQGNPLTILRGGAIVPQSSLIEVKSPSQKSAAKQKWAEIYPQLYLSQTPWLYKAIHCHGQFYVVKKTQLGSPELADVAERSKLRFQKLKVALQIIKDIVMKSGAQGRLSFVLENRELKVYDRSNQASCLPADIMAHFR
jgi:hypothetical protein